MERPLWFESGLFLGEASPFDSLLHRRQLFSEGRSDQSVSSPTTEIQFLFDSRKPLLLESAVILRNGKRMSFRLEPFSRDGACDFSSGGIFTEREVNEFRNSKTSHPEKRLFRQIQSLSAPESRYQHKITRTPAPETASARVRGCFQSNIGLTYSLDGACSCWALFGTKLDRVHIRRKPTGTMFHGFTMFNTVDLIEPIWSAVSSAGLNNIPRLGLNIL
jgi:hypothetical protein